MPHQSTPAYRAMFEAACQTFENMAFVQVAEQADELNAEIPENPVWVSILVHDPLQGELRLALPPKLLESLTADMFGIEIDQVEIHQQQDIIAEILNTLAGLFMTKLLPADQTYQLGLPEHGSDELPQTEDDAIVLNLEIEQSPLLLVATGSGFMSYNLDD